MEKWASFKLVTLNALSCILCGLLNKESCHSCFENVEKRCDYDFIIGNYEIGISVLTDEASITV